MAYDDSRPVWDDEPAFPDAAPVHWRMRRDLERAENNAHLRDHLTETEQIRLAARQHLIVLWKPIIAVVLAVGLLLRSVSDIDGLGSTQDFFLWLAIAAALWLFWRWLYWSRNLFVATDRRILKVYGVLSTTVDSMRNQKVTDMRYRRDPLGEILGYGSITIESAGQDQALHDITFLPFPRENYQELCHVIFGEAPRSGGRKKNRLRRRLERMTTRRSVADATDAYPSDYPDHRDVGGDERDVIEHYDRSGDGHARMLYSSHEQGTAPTGPIPLYPPGFFGRDGGDDDLDSDPTRP
ncbi:MAG: PH domain-containing protein [Dermatophilaceae bacterium]|nr:PH domain-containing protein [Intrasporangiaceae bacterium]